MAPDEPQGSYRTPGRMLLALAIFWLTGPLIVERLIKAGLGLWWVPFCALAIIAYLLLRLQRVHNFLLRHKLISDPATRMTFDRPVSQRKQRALDPNRSQWEPLFTGWGILAIVIVGTLIGVLVPHIGS